MFFCNILEEQCSLNTLLKRTRVSKLDTGCAKVMKLLSSRFLTKMIDELYFDRIVHGNMIWTYLCLSSCGCDGVHMRCSLNLQLLLGKGEYQKKILLSEKISGKKGTFVFLDRFDLCNISVRVPAGNPWLLLALLCVHLVKTSPLLRGLEQTTVEDLKYQKNTLAIDGSKQTTDFTQNIKSITLAIDEREVGGSGRVGSSLKHKMIFCKFDRILKNITEIFWKYHILVDFPKEYTISVT